MSPESLSDGRAHPLEGVQRQPIRITDVKVTLLSCRLRPEEQWADGDANVVIVNTCTVVVEVFTDAGIVGIGGCSRYSGPEQMKQYLEEVIRPFLIGKNPFDVESLSGGLSGPRGLSAWTGVDVALWDLIGKAAGLPVYRLLATDVEPRTRLRVYASGGEFSWRRDSPFDGPESLIEKAVAHQAAGYTAFKFRMGGGFGQLGITLQEYIPYLYRIREAVGPDFGLIQEANCRWSVEQCLQVAPVLEELGFLWFEEPTSKAGDDAIDNYLLIKRALPTVMVSGGEGRPNRRELMEFVDRGAYDIVQHGCDDAGMTEAWHMARMAHTRGKLFCAHNWQGGLVTIANAHLMAACPNSFLLESNMTPNPLKEGLFRQKLAVQDGHLDLPDGPGLGVELREDLAEEYPFIPGPWNIPDPGKPRSGPAPGARR
ncbi:MAG: mandelate racemase/muconate lactonizing enzyme family protein [Gemmatimonadota bacterium]